MYPPEILKTEPDEDDSEWWSPEDDGTMPANRDKLAEAVVGHRIVSAVKEELPKSLSDSYYRADEGLALTLDDGTKVYMVDTSDCCAYTQLETFLLHPDKVDHIITGVGTTGKFTKWHIYADMGDVLELEVGWSSGNPFYYAYGFDILVVPAPATDEETEKVVEEPEEGTTFNIQVEVTVGDVPETLNISFNNIPLDEMENTLKQIGSEKFLDHFASALESRLSGA